MRNDGQQDDSGDSDDDLLHGLRRCRQGIAGDHWRRGDERRYDGGGGGATERGGERQAQRQRGTEVLRERVRESSDDERVSAGLSAVRRIFADGGLVEP